MAGPVFNSPEQAITVMFHMLQRLTIVVAWCLVGLAHAGLAVVAGLAMWWFQVTPEAVESAALAAIESRPFVVLSAGGLSVASLVAVYWWLVRWAGRKATSGWLLEYLLQDSIER